MTDDKQGMGALRHARRASRRPQLVKVDARIIIDLNELSDAHLERLRVAIVLEQETRKKALILVEDRPRRPP